MDSDLKKIIEESLDTTFKSGIPISGEEKYFEQQPGGTFGTSNVDGIMQELQSIDEDAFRVYNDTLCPALWNESLQLDPAVRSGLLKVAEDFYEKTGFKAPIIDVYLMGSIANYNWTPDSDADVHIIINYDQLQMPAETVKEIVRTVASQWNAEHEVTVKGHKVEINFQNVKEQKPHVTGIYSLKYGQWARQPVKQNVQINKMLVQTKYKAMKKYVEAVINSGDRDAMKQAKKYIDAFRQYGLDTAGELSVENIVFKALRAKGLLTQLKNSIVQVYDKEMTVREVNYKDINQTHPNVDKFDLEAGEYNLSKLTLDNLKALKEKSARFIKALSQDPDKKSELYYEISEYKKLDAEIKRRMALINAPVAVENPNEPFEEGYGAGIPETDRLKIHNNDGSVKRWQIRSKDAPKTPQLSENISLTEMPQMTLKNKQAFAGEVPLKNLPLPDVIENIVIFRNPTDGFLPSGFTLVYFMDSNESAENIKAGSIPYLMIPRGTFYSGGSPITDIWKKKFQRPGTEHILGMMEAMTNEDVIFLDMVTVRPGWQRNKIATLMYKALREKFPTAKLETSSRTDKGEKYYQSIVKTPTETPVKTDEDVDSSLNTNNLENPLHAWFKKISQTISQSDRINLFPDDNVRPEYKKILNIADKILLKKYKSGVKYFDFEYIDQLMDDIITGELSTLHIQFGSSVYKKFKNIFINILARDYDIRTSDGKNIIPDEY